MKKTILFAMFLGGVFAASAQTTVGTTTLKVNLYPIQDITVNQANVNLDYKTKSDYLNGVGVNQKDHLTVYSTGAFAVTVNSSGANLTNTINDDKISAADITITASKGSNATAVNAASFTPVKLSKSAQTLIASDKGGVSKNFNVNYAASGALNAYVNKYYNGQNPTVYTTTVTYTIAAR